MAKGGIAKIDVEKPEFGALLVALKRRRREVPAELQTRWMQSIIAAAAHPMFDPPRGPLPTRSGR